jgi:hypothetical protein
MLWDHYPTDAELSDIVVDPESLTDQWGHEYKEIVNMPGDPVRICSSCQRDFTDGWAAQAPLEKRLFVLLICDDHAMNHSLMDAEEEAEVGAPD